jgi:ABC-2 type transport system permease protein
MLREVIRFEWRYHTRQVAFPVGVLFFFGMGFLLPVLGYGPPGTHLNSPFVVMQSVGLLSLLTVFVLTVFCANAVARDAEHGMKEIVYATSVGKLRYLTARFAGAVAAALTVFSCTVVGLYLAPLVGKVDPAKLGDPHPLAYLWALLVLALPNMLFAGAVVFALAVLTRSVLASYVGSVFLYMLYMVVSMMIGSPLMAGATPQSPQAMARAAVLDPFGISAFFQQTWYWTPAQRDTQLLALDGYFLVNRLLVLGVAAAILFVTYRLFSFRLAAGARPAKAEEGSARPGGGGGRYGPAAVAPESVKGRWAALRVATLREFRATAASKSFLALQALWLCVAAISVADGPVKYADYRTRLYPTTGTLLEAIEVPLAFVATLMLVYFGAEVVWRERVVRADEIVDATPAPDGVFYLAKGGALVLLSWLMALVAVAVSAGYQLSSGYTNLQPEVYLSLFYYTGLPLALFAVVVMLVQTLSPNRYVGIFFGMILGLLMLSPGELGLSHGLLRFGNPPRAAYSEMNGFLAPGTFGVYMLYWAGLAGVLALVTLGLWRRGRAQTLRGRVRALPRRWGRRGLAGAAACLSVFVCVGGFVFYNTNVLAKYETREEGLDWRAYYEKEYRRYEQVPQPSVVAVTTAVDLYPAERRFEVAGAYRLENRTAQALETVLVSLRRGLRPEQMELDGARLLRHDEPSGVYVFEFTQPLAPGAATELRFRVHSPPLRVEADGLDFTVVKDGSYVTRQAAFPRLGYVTGYEIEDPSERSERGLGPPRKGAGLVNDPSNDDKRAAWLTVDSTVSTTEEQFAIGPGDFVREWREGGRRYFQYRTAQPSTPLFGFVSGRYEVRRVEHGGVSLEVYYHAGHDYNVEKMLATAALSLDMFGARFGPYPHRHLRIVELPRYWGFGAFALPGLILWPEDRGFLTDTSGGGEIDIITRRLAHEVSHQWWGHQLYPAQVEGGTMLVETLAKYSELLVLEATRGKGSLPPLLRFERETYLLSRTNTPFPEPPLMRVVDLEHVYYSKGAIVMEALRDLIGEEALNRALRRLLSEHGPTDTPATTLDLLAALHAEAAPEQHALIDEWVREVSFVELRVEAASAEELPGGRYRVTATVLGRKTLDPAGGTPATEVPLDEMIDVAVYATHPLSTDAAPLYAGKQRLRTGRNEVTFEVSGRPGFVSLDPFERRIEAERADNVRELQVSPRP